MPRCAVETWSMESFLTHAGYLALILFAFVEACSIPISSEITFGFGGVLAYQGHLNLALVIIIGTLAEVAGSFVSYGVGRKGGRAAVDRLGKYVLLTHRDLDRAERFFAGRGAWVVALARVIPLVRAFAGLVSGLIEIPIAPFAVFNLIGTALWAAALSTIGYAVGSQWAKISHYMSVGSYVLVAFIVVPMAVLIVLRLREFRRERALGLVPVSSSQGDAAPPNPGARNDEGSSELGQAMPQGAPVAAAESSAQAAPDGAAAQEPRRPASHRRTSRPR
jgi:membrane protein DedA with SNARE-associated domain